MDEFLLLMHDDVTDRAIADDDDAWGAWFARLRESGRFDGGSAIGPGGCFRRVGAAAPPSSIEGFVRVRANDLDGARKLLDGNPNYEGGGTVEIRLLPRDS